MQERASEQLRQLQSSQRYIGGSNGFERSSESIGFKIIFSIQKFLLLMCHFFWQATILRMMDEEDGVINRRSKKNGKKKGDQTRLLLEGMGDSQDDLHLWALSCKRDLHNQVQLTYISHIWFLDNSSILLNYSFSSNIVQTFMTTYCRIQFPI